MNRFENREGNNLNRKVLVVEKVTRDGTAEILSLEVKVIRGDNSLDFYNASNKLVYSVKVDVGAV